MKNSFFLIILLFTLFSCASSWEKYQENLQKAHQRVIEGNASEQDYYLVVADFNRKSQPKKALEVIEKALPIASNSYGKGTRFIDEKITALMVLERHEEALKAADQLIELKALGTFSLKQGLIQKAKLLDYMGRFQEAIDEIEKVQNNNEIKLNDSDKAKIYSHKSFIYYKMGKKDLSRKNALDSMEEYKTVSAEVHRLSKERGGPLADRNIDVASLDTYLYATLSSFYLEKSDFWGANKVAKGNRLSGMFNDPYKKILTVNYIIPNSPFALAGVQIGDEILKLNRVDMTNRNVTYGHSGSVDTFIGNSPSNMDRLDLTIRRGNDIKLIKTYIKLSPKLLTFYPPNYPKLLAKAKKVDTFRAYAEFLRTNPKATNKETAAKLALSKISPRSKKAFEQYSEIYRYYPLIKEFIPKKNRNQVKYASIGPSDLSVAIISTYLKKGTSEALLEVKIEAVKEPYKNFSLEEVQELREMKIPQSLITAMIKVTTKLEAAAPKKYSKNVHGEEAEEGGLIQEATNTISSCLKKKAAKKGCSFLPGFLGTICNMGTEATSNCPL